MQSPQSISITTVLTLVYYSDYEQLMLQQQQLIKLTVRSLTLLHNKVLLKCTFKQ